MILAIHQADKIKIEEVTKIMTEYDYWKIFPKMPKKVTIGDITVRDGFQHEEKFISTDAKIFYAQEMILAGAKEIEVTNLGSPIHIPSSGMLRRSFRP